MADIKVREVNRGSIKTLDRAASSMHHIKEATVRTRTSDLLFSQGRDTAGRQAATPVRVSRSICCFPYEGLVTPTFHSSSGKKTTTENIHKRDRPQAVFSISATRISALSYTAFSGLHWKPDWFVLPGMEELCGSTSLSCSCHTAASRVIPFFRKGVYCSGGTRRTFDLHPSGTAPHFLP